MTVHTAEHIRIKSANVPPAQTWNRLRANSLALTVPKTPDAGTVYLPLPRLFERIECGMGPEVTNYIDSQVFEATYHEVPAHTTRKEPIVISVSAAENECTNTGVMVREGAEATIVVVARAGEKNTETAADNTGAKANAEADAPATSAALVRIVAEKHARIHLVEMLGIDDDQQHLESVGIEAHEDAVCDVRQYALGGGAVGMGLAVNLVGNRARLDLNNRYHACHEELLDINHVARMRGCATRAEIAESGILNDSARKTLRATIDLIRGSKDAKGNEAETVQILGDGVVNKTMPVILCDEDNVAGNHGATIGSVSPEQIEYLQARGLSRHEAELLFVRALFEDAIIHAPEALSHTVAVERAEKVLGADVAHDFDDATEATFGGDKA
ncbi:SufB/SufD family protein [Lancefieldella rimae]|uniref:SufB/sufD domain protein n=1 Tax=Lancefieldella rimae (strain ATCC 49626 / DSM 7090 / CCUG 31168 / NBRC 15546 / VPI D140H-11A) TaxID=553184 RepID=B9CL15_LANR4|nr:SufD family Fe-S cluster assembly protein [Lancefieldella rimae]EEE17882.1 SufB/sufD domain protein [Lancefieldella rimae ATCC 49626]